jgi:hypothetical protein
MSNEVERCKKCGTTLPEDATFCPSCGTPVAGEPVPPPPRRREHRSEKQEKGEKHEKGEKGEKHEKGGDRSGAVIGGLILIWLGVSFYLAQRATFAWADWWAYFLSGLGVIIIVSGLVRYVDTGGRYPLTGSLIGGGVLTVIGLAGLMDWGDIWYLILIIIGAGVIVSGLTARSRAPRP